MGGGASKPEPAVKGDGVTTVDNSFSVVNIHHQNCCIDPMQPVQQLPIYRLPAPAPRRHSYGDVKPGSVVEIIRMEDGSEAVMRTYAVGEGKPRQS